jgi:hypothetical protein
METKMTHLMNLRKLSNENLITDLRGLVTQERELTTRILHYLKEVEERKLYLEKGYSSLFAFLTEEIGYSESTAYRRIQAMRLIQDMPQVEEKLQKGKLSLTVASQFQDFIKKENKKRKMNRKPKLSTEEKGDLLAKIEGTSSRKCQQKLVELSPELALPQEKTKPLTPETIFYQFTANKKLHKNIQRLKNLTSHQNPEGKLEALFEEITDIALDRLDPERREARRKKRSNFRSDNSNELEPLKAKKEFTSFSMAPGRAPEGARGRGEEAEPLLSALKVDRYISPKLRDKIWLRDQGKCQYRDKKTGKTCGSKHFLEIDHRYPYSLGGEHFEENLQLRCRAHNQYQVKLLF